MGKIVLNSKSRVLKNLVQNRCFNSIEDCSSVTCVSSTSDMSENTFFLIFTLSKKLLSDKIRGLLNIISTCLFYPKLSTKKKTNLYTQKSSFFLLPVYSGKQHVRSLCLIFSSNKSRLFKNKIMEVSTNHLLLEISLNNLRDSCMRLVWSSSYSFKSYSLRATQKRTAVTSWKQCIHFLRSLRCPPTSTSKNLVFSIVNSISIMPVVLARARKMSSTVGM